MGWKYIKIQQKSLCGDPDLVVCVNGIYVELELKRSSAARVAKLQIYELMRCNKSGGYGMVVYPEIFDILKEFLVVLSHLGAHKRVEIPKCLRLKILN